MTVSKFYVTTPIYYVNDRPHLGHSYTAIAADILARYQRLTHKKVFFLTGTDEHGAKIEAIAQKNNKTPKELADENSEAFRKNWKLLNISFDKYIRTTDPGHVLAVQKALQKLYNKGIIYKGEYEGLYCVGCEQYKTESDLVNGECPDHKVKPQLVKEESYLFKLSSFEKKLKSKIESKELGIYPKEKRNEVISFLEKGLKDISISRKNVKWGVPLPFNSDFTAYVWIDALLNYLTGLGWKGDLELSSFWPPEVQLMAKDILRIHSTIWPALLLALDIPLPQTIFAHGYFTINGQKMSKSLGNVIWPEELVKKFGADATRYLLISACPFGKDGDLSLDKLEEKYNSDLANGIGNLTNRILTMLENKLNGVVPKVLNHIPNSLTGLIEDYDLLFYRMSLDEITKRLMDICLELDKRIDQESIYRLDSDRFSKEIYSLVESLRIWAWLAMPFMPETSDSIFEKLGLDIGEEKDKSLYSAMEWGGIKTGTRINKGDVLFPRL